MQKTYTVIEIYEADFGCEERPEGQETMVGIRLKAEDGEETPETDSSDKKEESGTTENPDKVIFIEGRIEKQC